LIHLYLVLGQRQKGGAQSISRVRRLNGVSGLVVDVGDVAVRVRSLLGIMAKARLRIPDVNSQSLNLDVAMTPQKESTETS
jgi:hypothetical protein